jgi:hypothetical protein
MSSCFLVFDSIHYVLAAEHEILENDIWCDLVPTPRSIDSNCGMVVQIRSEDISRIQPVMDRLSRKPRSIYRLVAGDYLPIDRAQ